MARYVFGISGLLHRSWDINGCYCVKRNCIISDQSFMDKFEETPNSYAMQSTTPANSVLQSIYLLAKLRCILFQIAMQRFDVHSS
jgi:hypothetical protein